MARTVLVAEDGKTTRHVLSFILANRGYEVIEVSDGKQAVKQAQERLPDLAILDAELPERSGYHVYVMLKGDPATCHIPVLLLVADTPSFSMPTRTVPPAECVMSKPFSAHDLLQRVGKLLT